MTMGKQFRPKELVLLYTTMSIIFVFMNVRDLLIANSEFVSRPLKQRTQEETASFLVPSSTKSKGGRYYYDEPDQLDPNIFQGVTARAFEPWTNEVRCFPKEDKSTPQKERGMMFLKTMKTGSTTAMGVQMKIAQNEAQRANSTADEPCESVHKHQFAFRGFPNRDRKKSFLWSIVRDPTSRLVSYLFFHYVSRLKKEPYDQGFIDFIRGSDSSAKYDHYMKWMSLAEYKPGETDPVQHANKILADYDFIAVTERMDESLVVLAMLMDLPLTDVLYLNGAKGNGGFDDGQFRGTCTYIWPSFISPGMYEFFRTPEFQDMIRWDHVIHQAANRSLDLTIERLGRGMFEANLHKFREARRISQEQCLPKTVFPCSTNGGKRPQKINDCARIDAGCGEKCLTQVAMELGL